MNSLISGWRKKASEKTDNGESNVIYLFQLLTGQTGLEMRVEMLSYVIN